MLDAKVIPAICFGREPDAKESDMLAILAAVLVVL
jgi:hypothetical protein